MDNWDPNSIDFKFLNNFFIKFKDILEDYDILNDEICKNELSNIQNIIEKHEKPFNHVQNVLNFKNVFENLKKYDIVLVAYENEKDNTLKNVLTKIEKDKKYFSIAVIIGPEGGIDISEIEQLKANINNIEIVTLGKRILRTETASLAVLSMMLYELED